MIKHYGNGNNWRVIWGQVVIYEGEYEMAWFYLQYLNTFGYR